MITCTIRNLECLIFLSKAKCTVIIPCFFGGFDWYLYLILPTLEKQASCLFLQAAVCLRKRHTGEGTRLLPALVLKTRLSLKKWRSMSWCQEPVFKVSATNRLIWTDQTSNMSVPRTPKRESIHTFKACLIVESLGVVNSTTSAGKSFQTNHLLFSLFCASMRHRDQTVAQRFRQILKLW